MRLEWDDPCFHLQYLRSEPNPASVCPSVLRNEAIAVIVR